MYLDPPTMQYKLLGTHNYHSIDQSSELGQALKKSQLELADALSEGQRLKEEYKSLQERLVEAQATAEVSSTFTLELAMKESRISQLEEEGKVNTCCMQLTTVEPLIANPPNSLQHLPNSSHKNVYQVTFDNANF